MQEYVIEFIPLPQYPFHLLPKQEFKTTLVASSSEEARILYLQRMKQQIHQADITGITEKHWQDVYQQIRVISCSL